MISSRRRFLLGAGAVFVAAPAIVRVASLMPISVPRPEARPIIQPFTLVIQTSIDGENWMSHADVNAASIASQHDLFVFGRSFSRMCLDCFGEKTAWVSLPDVFAPDIPMGVLDS